MLFECIDLIGKKFSFNAEADDEEILYDVVDREYKTDVSYDKLVVIFSGKDAREIKMKQIKNLDIDSIVVRILYNYYATKVRIVNANSGNIIVTFDLDGNKTFMDQFKEYCPEIAKLDGLAFTLRGKEIDTNSILSATLAESSTIQLHMYKKLRINPSSVNP